MQKLQLIIIWNASISKIFINNLQDLQNLVQFEFVENYLNEIVIEQAMQSVTQFKISGNQIKRADFLMQMPNVIDVDLSKNIINNIISPVTLLQIAKEKQQQQLNYLQKLNLQDNSIDNFESAILFPNIISLNLNNNLFTRLEFVQQLTNLQELNVSHNNLTSLKDLSKHPTLKTVYAMRNKIQNLYYLNFIPNLQYLCIFNNNISTLLGIEKQTNLQYLNITNNKILHSDQLVYLKNLDNLTELFCSENKFLKNKNIVNELYYVLQNKNMNLGQCLMLPLDEEQQKQFRKMKKEKQKIKQNQFNRFILRKKIIELWKKQQQLNQEGKEYRKVNKVLKDSNKKMAAQLQEVRRMFDME